MTDAPRLSLLRRGDATDRVTTVELFFDLVYVFAITQLSDLLVRHTSLEGVVQAAVLLAMVWQAWVYTTWTMVITAAADPAKVARNAFHWTHPVIVAGIIAAAAADHLVLADPNAHGRMSTAWLVLGGTALFLAGHAVFKAVVWRIVSWPRVAAVAVLALLAVLAPHVSALTLTVLALAVVVAVAAADYVLHRLAAAALTPAEPVHPD